jgi:hypothetical protein
MALPYAPFPAMYSALALPQFREGAALHDGEEGLLVAVLRGSVLLKRTRQRSSQRWVRCMLSVAYLISQGQGVHSSKAITMSAPMLRWMSITFSGVNRCLLPSMWLLNFTPSSVILRMSLSECTWKPPLSVRMGRSQPLNRCKPPACSSTSVPGRRYRW